MLALHPLKRRLLAEEFARLRRADEQRRYLASQRRGRIDPNPHQIDAVVFAPGRIPDGGCILADEVGLGKTIEAGLVMAQLLAEGMRRILLIVPKSLLGQWQMELRNLFGIEAREGRLNPEAFAGDGVFLVHREFAGGKGSSLLKEGDPFDLLRRRLGSVLQRTLHSQAKDFLEVPFVERQARLIEYEMSPEEKELHEQVTAWLMEPYLCSFGGKNRRLLLIGFQSGLDLVFFPTKNPSKRKWT